MKKTTAAITGAAVAALVGLVARGAAAQCCGDCNANNEVTVNELVTAVNRALTPAPCTDDGICGAASIRGLKRMDFSSTADSAAQKKAFAKCPTGLKVVGGGAKVFIAGERTGPVALKASFPNDTLDGWAATAEETAATDLTWFVTAFALCATVAD